MAVEKKNRKASYIITLVILLVLIVLLGVASYRFDRITSNPAGTIGNTAGNLNNAGLFCEYDGTVYFANPLDNGTLYTMSPDETNLRKLNNSKVRNILAGGDYLYYFQLGSVEGDAISTMVNARSFNRSNLEGKKVAGITNDVVITGQLINDHLYLLTTGADRISFYKIKTDKSGKTELADYAINPACAGNNSIYYNGTLDNHALYCLDTATDISQQIWAGNLWNPVLNGDYIYYMDLNSNYRLCRYSLVEQTTEVLTADRVDCFNVGSGYIYYQKNDASAPQLKCMHTDGSNVLVVADGIYTNINMTSQYVYFQEYRAENSLYHSRLGSDHYSAFSQ